MYKDMKVFLTDSEIWDKIEEQCDEEARKENGIVDGDKKQTAFLWAKWMRDEIRGRMMVQTEEIWKKALQ